LALEFVPNLIRQMPREAPAMQIRSVVLEPSELEGDLESGDVDLAIGYFPDLISCNLQQQLLFKHNFACLIRRGHPKVSGELTLDQFLNLQHVVVEHRARRRDLFEWTLEKGGSVAPHRLRFGPSPRPHAKG
jgi:DNA-binding transcriptional LysR family regulator